MIARRIGAQFGFGGGGDLAVMRFDAFANYEISELDVYGHLTQRWVNAVGGTYLIGKTALELGGTHHRVVGETPVAFRLGFMLPVLDDTSDGFVAAAGGTIARPSDVVFSIRSSTALRASASATYRRQRLIVQGDAGIDVAFLPGSDIKPLARADAGVGFGTRRRIDRIAVLGVSESLTDRFVVQAGAVEPCPTQVLFPGRSVEFFANAAGDYTVQLTVTEAYRSVRARVIITAE